MIFPKKKKKKISNVTLGTLYDMNKGIIEKSLPNLTEEEMQNKKHLIIDFLNDTQNNYYMFLCNDRKDYTIFTLGWNSKNENITNAANILIDECLINRGNTKSIEYTKNKDAVEIWISIEGESYCYMLFPYDAAIIQC